MTANTRQSTILLVEDDHLAREVVAENLREAGYLVVAMPDGEAALQALPSVQPGLILSDVRMPRCTGFELLARVRAMSDYRPIPFIIMSARADTSDIRRGMSLGADDYVTKPCLTEDLLETIKMRLARSAMFNEAIRRQQNFLSRVLPHELRTPLSGVMGYADLMIEIGQAGETLSPEDLVDYGTNLQRSGQRLLRVAEDLSLWSWFEVLFDRLRFGKPVELTPITVTKSELEPWIDVIVERVGRKRDVTLDLQPATVNVPSDGLVRVIQHLVENALKFSLQTSPVQITGVLQGAHYEITFRDRGRGMSKEEIEGVGMLLQFRRETHEQQGLGMGLALARNFAQLAGGEFSVISNQPEQGITARLRLLAAEALPAK